MKQFYLYFPKLNALRSELTWTHYRLILRVEKEEIRKFYMIECIENSWSTRELERQINSLLYERLALSRDKNKVKELSKKGQIVKTPKDIIKDPYVLEFLDIIENREYLEKNLEKLLLNKLKGFLLELGKGFSFVSRQKRITVEGDHFYVDLVFYNHILKCFVLIDLKIGKLTHKDIGQMDFYVRYFEREEKKIGDNPTIGIILCSNKNEAMVKYTMLEDKKGVFVSKYKLYLPSEEEHKKGNSFVYCALRDGKVISSRYDLNLKQPKKCQKAAIDRLDFAKRNIERIDFFLRCIKKSVVAYPELEDLGYCSMHICWAVCMFNNFCPVSKYTILRECKKYFSQKEFKAIEKAYDFYADKNNREIKKETFVRLFNILKSILARIGGEYVLEGNTHEQK